MVSLRVCVDVPSLEAGIAFYCSALGLTVGRRFGDDAAELLGGPVPIDLLVKPAGSRPSPHADDTRRYARHWTPVHLDVVVSELEASLALALRAGAVLEGEIADRPWGRMALLADPFGHGLCLLEFRGRGYDALASQEA